MDDDKKNNMKEIIEIVEYRVTGTEYFTILYRE